MAQVNRIGSSLGIGLTGFWSEWVVIYISLVDWYRRSGVAQCITTGWRRLLSGV